MRANDRQVIEGGRPIQFEVAIPTADGERRFVVVNERENVLQASAGMYTHLDGEHSRIPVGMLKIGLIAQEREPHQAQGSAS